MSDVEIPQIDIKKIESPHEKEALAEFDRRRKARKLTLPIDDVRVKLTLRRCNEPICLFGEDILDRRERLRTLLSKLSEEEVHQILYSDDKDKPEQKEEVCTWYHVGSAALRQARVAIADYSLTRARDRLERARARSGATSQKEHALVRQETHKWIQNLELYGSQVRNLSSVIWLRRGLATVSGLRPSSFCEFSPDSGHIITTNWSGQVSIWRIPDCEEELNLAGHACQVGCARFHPRAFTVGHDPYAIGAASCDHGGRVLLWNLRVDEPIHELERHLARVSHIAFHPSGDYLATCCHDSTWRLYDLETQAELLLQEGHSRSVFDLDFQTDGALALSGGMDGYGRAWDLRTGRCIMFLEGHQKEIFSVNWHPNGFMMVTGSADHTVKVWDVRMRRCVYTIPAHQNLVTRARIDPTGEFLVTSSYDNTVKLWTTGGWQPLRILEGHQMKVMCVDVSPDGKWVASASYDRTFKLWTSRLHAESLEQRR